MSEAQSPLTERVWAALKQVRFPGLSRDVVSFGFVERVDTQDGEVAVALKVPTHNPGAAEQIRNQVEQALSTLEGVRALRVEVQVQAPRSPAQAPQRAVMKTPSLLPDVRFVVAVASGKGGVGKSTVAANLAISLARAKYRVGLLDCDIYGPSVPTMFGIHDRPAVAGQRLSPFFKYGIKLMSLGFILDSDTPLIWRGPMVMKAVEQLLGDVDWGELDFLVVDLPPGTGDAQLSLSQKVPLSGAVIVSTPQDVALIDARKGLHMFRKVNVPVIGLVENMSSFVCPHCGGRTDVFRHGGGEATAQELGCAFLGRVPLDGAIALGGDQGVPIVVAQPDGDHAAAFARIAAAVAAEVLRQHEHQPTLSIL